MDLTESGQPGEAWARHRGARAGVFGEAARGREIVQASIPPTSRPLQPWRHEPGRVGYESQREIPVSRAMRRAQMIKMRLGGSGDPFEPFPQKPRRMHWRTYVRLREQARAADADAEGLLAQSMPGFKELLALSGVVDPPRR